MIINVWEVRDNKLAEHGYKNYKQYLKSKEWKNIKKTIRKKTTKRWNTCNLCSKSGRLDIHHQSYHVIGINKPTLTLRMLCRKCHKQLHAYCKLLPDKSFYDAYRDILQIRKDLGIQYYK